MDYEGQICRTPMERGSYMLPVSVGCSYNRCRFCMLFKHLAYRPLPLSQIEAELLRVKNAGGSPKRVFFGDGNAFQLTADALLEIISLLHRYFPCCTDIRMDATVTGIAQKRDSELAALFDAGVHTLYLGIESGLDDVLCQMDKDHTLQEAYTQISRLHEAGMHYGAHIMTGIAGAGRGMENSAATADFLNRSMPQSVTNFSLFLHCDAPLYQDIRNGSFRPASETENLEEARELIRLLDVEGLAFDGFHDFIGCRVRGTLPKDRERMLASLDAAILRQKALPPCYAYTDQCPPTGCTLHTDGKDGCGCGGA